MNDINTIIDETVKRTGQPEAIVEKIVRSMFADIYDFTTKKKGYNIQIPEVGTFIFKAGAIPNYIVKTKATLAYWIGRLYIGEHKKLEKTINAAKNNISYSLHSLNKVALIKKRFIEQHSKYKPLTRAYLETDTDSDIESISEFISLVESQLFIEECYKIQENDL